MPTLGIRHLHKYRTNIRSRITEVPFHSDLGMVCSEFSDSCKLLMLAVLSQALGIDFQVVWIPRFSKGLKTCLVGSGKNSNVRTIFQRLMPSIEGCYLQRGMYLPHGRNYESIWKGSTHNLQKGKCSQPWEEWSDPGCSFLLSQYSQLSNYEFYFSCQNHRLFLWSFHLLILFCMRVSRVGLSYYQFPWHFIDHAWLFCVFISSRQMR